MIDNQTTMRKTYFSIRHHLPFSTCFLFYAPQIAHLFLRKAKRTLQIPLEGTSSVPIYAIAQCFPLRVYYSFACNRLPFRQADSRDRPFSPLCSKMNQAVQNSTWRYTCSPLDDRNPPAHFFSDYMCFHGSTQQQKTSGASSTAPEA